MDGAFRRARAIATACLIGASVLRASTPGHPPADPPLRAPFPTPQAADTSATASDTAAGINRTRLIIVGGVMAGAMVGVHLYQESGWWKYNRAPFHFSRGPYVRPERR